MIGFNQEYIHGDYLITYKVNIGFLIPETEDNGELKLDGGAYNNKNVGQFAVLIEDKWTLLPGDSIPFGTDKDLSKVVANLKYKKLEKFTLPIPCYEGVRLEIMELTTTICSVEPLSELKK